MNIFRTVILSSSLKEIIPLGIRKYITHRKQSRGTKCCLAYDIRCRCTIIQMISECWWVCIMVIYCIWVVYIENLFYSLIHKLPNGYRKKVQYYSCCELELLSICLTDIASSYLRSSLYRVRKQYISLTCLSLLSFLKCTYFEFTQRTLLAILGDVTGIQN